MTEQLKNAPVGETLAAAERVADLAHELRSPLGGIESMIALLGESKAASEQDALIAGLRSAAAHLRTVANRLLRQDARAAESVVVSDALAFFSVSARARARAGNMVFHQDVDPICAATIVADATTLRQMLENLVDNAIRHSGGNTITLRVTPTEGDSGQVCFEVLDTGAGETSRAGGAETDKTGGKGLAIVANLARSGGGASGFGPRSDGPGCRAWFTVPVLGRRDAIGQNAAPTPVAVAPILVVEDDAINQLLLKTVLGHLGYTIEPAQSVAEALALLRTGTYSAIFSDMSIPDVDGWTFVRQLRQSGCTIPIVGVTGHVLPEDKRRTLDAGADWVVEKPVTVHDLRQALIATGLRDPMERQVNAA